MGITGNRIMDRIAEIFVIFEARIFVSKFYFSVQNDC
jgi:hypothetical protein